MFSNYVKTGLTHLNQSKFLIGIIMIIMNVSSKYIDIGFSKTQEQALKNGLAREILIFSIAFTATRDIVTAFILTGTFMLLSDVLFNEKSQFCLIPERMKQIELLVDTNKDGIISLDEEKKAIETLKRAEKQRERQQQGIFLSHLALNSANV